MFGRVLQTLGQVYLAQRALKKAQGYIEKSLSIFQQNKSYGASYSLELLADISLSKYEQGIKDSQGHSRDYKIQAINYLKEALSIIKLHFPENSRYVIRIKNKLSSLQSNKPMISLNDG